MATIIKVQCIPDGNRANLGQLHEKIQQSVNKQNLSFLKSTDVCVLLHSNATEHYLEFGNEIPIEILWIPLCMAASEIGKLESA